MTDARPRRPSSIGRESLEVLLDVQTKLIVLTQRMGTLHNDVNVINLALQGAQGELARVSDAVGSEEIDETGQKKGKGLYGRVGRIENKQTTLDRWVNRAVGMAMAASLLGGVLWWLLGDKLDKVLKGGA